MTSEARDFQKRVRRENAGREGTRLRYSRELRREAVAYVQRTRRSGGTLERAASELGVSMTSLSRWSSEPKAALRRIEVLEPAETSALSLVTPRGYRVEGLSEERLLRLVERLG
jgi:transposase-like protein